MREEGGPLLPLLACGYLLTSSLLSGMLAVRLVAQRPFRQISILQFLALLLLAMSLLFVITLAIVILGKGAHPQQVAYEGVMWLRIFLYALSKLVLFLFLLEKVWSVHGLAVLGHRNHLDSKWYRMGALMVIGWVGVAVLLFPGRIVRLRNGTCYVGLKRFTSIPLLVVEIITYSYLSLAFLFPIWRSKSLEVVRLGRRSSVAALVSLSTSVSNGIILTALHGEELSYAPHRIRTLVKSSDRTAGVPCRRSTRADSTSRPSACRSPRRCRLTTSENPVCLCGRGRRRYRARHPKSVVKA